MAKKKALPRDPNQRAKSIVDMVTADDDSNCDTTPKKNQAAVELGRLGGLKGGKARAKKLTPAQRSEIARNAAKKRWQTKNPNPN